MSRHPYDGGIFILLIDFVAAYFTAFAQPVKPASHRLATSGLTG